MSRALLLNADWSPLRFVSDRRAVMLFMNGRAEVVHDFLSGSSCVWDETFASPCTLIKVPATLRLKRFVNYRWKPPRFRSVLFNRDGWRCQYCGDKLSDRSIEVEHILPASRGGQTSWSNCVATCKPCNKKKANRTPEEAGMQLLRKPMIPTSLHFWDALKSDDWHETWNAFVKFNE